MKILAELIKQTVITVCRHLYYQRKNHLKLVCGGQRYLRHLKENHRIIYYNYLTKGILNKHITEVDIRAEKIFQQLVKSLAEKENVTESLKAKDMMLWVQKMNNIRNRASEIVNTEVIFV